MFRKVCMVFVIAVLLGAGTSVAPTAEEGSTQTAETKAGSPAENPKKPSFDGRFIAKFLQETHATGELSEREKHLVGLAVTITRGCTVCTTSRIEQARNAGITDDTLNALVGVVSSVNAGVSAATAATSFGNADAKQAEIVCSGGVCTVPSHSH